MHLALKIIVFQYQNMHINLPKNNINNVVIQSSISVKCTYIYLLPTISNDVMYRLPVRIKKLLLIFIVEIISIQHCPINPTRKYPRMFTQPAGLFSNNFLE